jgi:hypothetical protein
MSVNFSIMSFISLFSAKTATKTVIQTLQPWFWCSLGAVEIQSQTPRPPNSGGNKNGLR